MSSESSRNPCAYAKKTPTLVRFFILLVLCFYVVFAITYQNPYSILYGNTIEQQEEIVHVFNSSLCGCGKRMFVPNAKLKPNKSEFIWCSEESFVRGYNQKVVAYSLFGDASNASMFKRYYSQLENISLTVEKEYPGWIVRIYHNIDDPPNREGFKSLCEVFCRFNHVDLCSMNSIYMNLLDRNTTCSRNLGLGLPIDPRLVHGLNPRMFRYLVMLDPQVDVFISRDVDSIIWSREVYAVQEWLESNYTFHLMRDHSAHASIILAGMWGAKLNKRRDLIEGVTRALIFSGQDRVGHTDQATLDRILWPTAKYDVMAHDSYHCETPSIVSTSVLKVFPFPRQRNGSIYVGGAGRELYPAICPVACRPENHKDWEYC